MNNFNVIYRWIWEDGRLTSNLPMVPPPDWPVPVVGDVIRLDRGIAAVVKREWDYDHDNNGINPKVILYLQ